VVKRCEVLSRSASGAGRRGNRPTSILYRPASAPDITHFTEIGLTAIQARASARRQDRDRQEDDGCRGDDQHRVIARLAAPQAEDDNRPGQDDAGEPDDGGHEGFTGSSTSQLDEKTDSGDLNDEPVVFPGSMLFELSLYALDVLR